MNAATNDLTNQSSTQVSTSQSQASMTSTGSTELLGIIHELSNTNKHISTLSASIETQQQIFLNALSTRPSEDMSRRQPPSEGNSVSMETEDATTSSAPNDSSSRSRRADPECAASEDRDSKRPRADFKRDIESIDVSNIQRSASAAVERHRPDEGQQQVMNNDPQGFYQVIAMGPPIG